MKIEDNENLSEFLEEGLREIYEHDATSVAIFARLEDGQILSGYWNVDVATKFVISGYIQQDTLVETLKTNNYIEDDEVEDDES